MKRHLVKTDGEANKAHFAVVQTHFFLYQPLRIQFLPLTTDEIFKLGILQWDERDFLATHTTGHGQRGHHDAAVDADPAVIPMK